MFTSSIASAQGWDHSKGAFPEEVQIDPGVAVGGGYGEGKYVAERVSNICLLSTSLLNIPRSYLPKVVCKALHSELVRFVVVYQTELGPPPTGCLLSLSRV